MKIHLFDWPSRHNVHLLLPLMIIVSLGLHVAGVIVFQIAHPRTHAWPMRSADVYFLRPDSPEAAKLEPLIASDDPALFSPAQPSGRDTWRLAESGYSASFDSSRPALMPAPARARASILPPISSTGPVNKGVDIPPPAKTMAPGIPTQMTLGGDLQGREATPPANASAFSAPARQNLEPTEFLVALSPDGHPWHVFQITSSTYEGIDRAAYRYLMGCRFSPEKSGATKWGTVTFLWGADVKRGEEP